jgi:catechol 2,3-dioxygenase-like lactoylglutathione lyase family enzyme
MIQFNHTNLQTPDVPGLRRFFETILGFHALVERGNGAFVVLRGEDGFILTLMHNQQATYPAQFHVGFIQPSQNEVHRFHAKIREAGFDAPEPAPLTQGGRNAFGFYSHAPGGVMVEISTWLA